CCRPASSSRFDSSSLRPASRSCNACRSSTSVRIAACMHSTLVIDEGCPVFDVARVSACGRVSVWMVEGVDRLAWCDFDVKARARYQVADGKLNAVDPGLPEKENFVRPAQPLGKFSTRRILFCDLALHDNPFGLRFGGASRTWKPRTHSSGEALLRDEHAVQEELDCTG